MARFSPWVKLGVVLQLFDYIYFVCAGMTKRWIRCSNTIHSTGCVQHFTPNRSIGWAGESAPVTVAWNLSQAAKKWGMLK